jgi:hypothetical protein
MGVYLSGCSCCNEGLELASKGANTKRGSKLVWGFFLGLVLRNRLYKVSVGLRFGAGTSWNWHRCIDFFCTISCSGSGLQRGKHQNTLRIDLGLSHGAALNANGSSEGVIHAVLASCCLVV